MKGTWIFLEVCKGCGVFFSIFLEERKGCEIFLKLILERLKLFYFFFLKFKDVHF